MSGTLGALSLRFRSATLVVELAEGAVPHTDPRYWAVLAAHHQKVEGLGVAVQAGTEPFLQVGGIDVVPLDLARRLSLQDGIERLVGHVPHPHDPWEARDAATQDGQR